MILALHLKTMFKTNIVDEIASILVSLVDVDVLNNTIKSDD